MRWLVLLLVMASPATAEITAARTLPVGAILGPADLVIAEGTPASEAGAVIGLQTRVIIYAGRAVTPAQLGPPMLVDRNQIVTLSYDAGALSIRAEGRALSAGAAGDVIRVMNLTSRQTVTATIRPDGILTVAAR